MSAGGGRDGEAEANDPAAAGGGGDGGAVRGLGREHLHRQQIHAAAAAAAAHVGGGGGGGGGGGHGGRGRRRHPPLVVTNLIRNPRYGGKTQRDTSILLLSNAVQELEQFDLDT